MGEDDLDIAEWVVRLVVAEPWPRAEWENDWGSSSSGVNTGTILWRERLGVVSQRHYGPLGVSASCSYRGGNG